VIDTCGGRDRTATLAIIAANEAAMSVTFRMIGGIVQEFRNRNPIKEFRSQHKVLSTVRQDQVTATFNAARGIK
jgi:hypothetical protein